jgi:hypothetical protein
MAALTFSQTQAKAREASARRLNDRDLIGAARAAIATAESTLEEAARTAGLAALLKSLACGRGCTFCCHQMVGITEAELALVKQAVAALPTADQAEIAATATALRAKAQGLNPTGWWKAQLPCPLLAADGGCRIHTDRPLPCRAMNSADVAVCRQSFDGHTVRIPMLAAQHGIFGHAQAGLLQALVAAGRPNGMIVLGTAL